MTLKTAAQNFRSVFDVLDRCIFNIIYRAFRTNFLDRDLNYLAETAKLAILLVASGLDWSTGFTCYNCQNLKERPINDESNDLLTRTSCDQEQLDSKTFPVNEALLFFLKPYELLAFIQSWISILSIYNLVGVSEILNLGCTYGNLYRTHLIESKTVAQISE